MSKKGLSLPQARDCIGQEIGCTDWLLVSQKDVNAFAKVTRDHQFIHTDPERAKESVFEGTIAHGFYSLSLLSYFAENGCMLTLDGMTMGVNYGFEKVRFLSPVRIGRRIRGRSTLNSIDEKRPGQFLFNSTISVEIEGEGTPALVAEWLTMIVTEF